MKYLLALLVACLVFVTFQAQAHDKKKPKPEPEKPPVTTVVEDPWHGEDKNAHFVILGLIPALIVSVETENYWYGVAAGSAVGLTKELLDSRKSTGVGFSGKDLAWTVLGSFAGAYLGGVIVDYNNKTTTISYNMRF